MQSGVTSTPLNVVGRASLENGGQGPTTPGQAPAVSYRLVKFDSSSGGQLGDNPGRFMLSGESAQASTELFQTANLAKPAHKKVSVSAFVYSDGSSVLSASGHKARPASAHESQGQGLVVLSRLALSRVILYCPVLCCAVLCCAVLSCPDLYYLVLSCTILSCLVVSSSPCEL